MELFLVPKGNKFIVEDKKERLLYTIKKKTFKGSKFVLLDASGYELYSLLQVNQGKKPEFNIILNDRLFMSVKCLSIFLEPSIVFEHESEKFKGIKYMLKSNDRKNFAILRNDIEVGSVKTVSTMDNELRYEMVIDNAYFDDYVPLFALAVERAFGDINKSK